jgi:hypothetical protein
MWDFIVLGDIPGTSIKITFVSWLYAVSALLWLLSMAWLFRQHTLLSWKIRWHLQLAPLLRWHVLRLGVGRQKTLAVQLQLFE